VILLRTSPSPTYTLCLVPMDALPNSALLDQGNGGASRRCPGCPSRRYGHAAWAPVPTRRAGQPPSAPAEVSDRLAVVDRYRSAAADFLAAGTPHVPGIVRLLMTPPAGGSDSERGPRRSPLISGCRGGWGSGSLVCHRPGQAEQTMPPWRRSFFQWGAPPSPRRHGPLPLRWATADERTRRRSSARRAGRRPGQRMIVVRLACN
jgi:hypothetical protein